MAERLRKARISFGTTNYDVANAHSSPSHASLSEALVRKKRDSLDDATSLPRWKSRVQTRASLTDQGPAQLRAAREQRMPFTGCTTNVLTNGLTTCEPKCSKKRSLFKHLLRSQIFSILLFLWDSQPTQTMCVSPRSPRSQPTNCQGCPGQRAG